MPSETAESGEDIQLTEWSIETEKPEIHHLQDDPTVNQDSKQQEALEFKKIIKSWSFEKMNLPKNRMMT